MFHLPLGCFEESVVKSYEFWRIRCFGVLFEKLHVIGVVIYISHREFWLPYDHLLNWDRCQKKMRKLTVRLRLDRNRCYVKADAIVQNIYIWSRPT